MITNSVVCPSPSWTKSYFVTMQSSSAMWTLPCKDNLQWKKTKKAVVTCQNQVKKSKEIIWIMQYLASSAEHLLQTSFSNQCRILPTLIFIVLIINYWVRAGRKNISTRSSLRGSQSSLSYALISIWPIMLINWAARLNARLVRNWFRNFSVSCVKKWTFLIINPITQRALRDP